jgi:hypothetical protein
MLSFKITVDNVRSLLRLSDKFEIEYLVEEIKVSFQTYLAELRFSPPIGSHKSAQVTNFGSLLPDMNWSISRIIVGKQRGSVPMRS